MIERDIYINSYRVFDPINVVEGNDQYPIKLNVKDVSGGIVASNATSYTIKAYSKTPIGTYVCDASLGDDNASILISPPSGFFIEGENLLQIEITEQLSSSQRVTYSFPMLVFADKNLFDDTAGSAQSVSQLVGKAEAAARQAKNSADRAEEIYEEELNPKYTQLIESYDELMEDIEGKANASDVYTKTEVDEKLPVKKTVTNLTTSYPSNTVTNAFRIYCGKKGTHLVTFSIVFNGTASGTMEVQADLASSESATFAPMFTNVSVSGRTASINFVTTLNNTSDNQIYFVRIKQTGTQTLSANRQTCSIVRICD